VTSVAIAMSITPVEPHIVSPIASSLENILDAPFLLDTVSKKNELKSVEASLAWKPAPIILKPPRIKSSSPPRAVLGVLQIATDLTMDIEGSLLVSQLPGVEIRHTKIALDAEAICAETYERALASGAIETAVNSLRWPSHTLAGDKYVSIFGVSCTSMSFTLGKRLLNCFPEGSKVTDMWQAVLAALHIVGTKRLAVLTPYIAEVSTKNVQLLESAGFRVVSSMSLGLPRDVETSAVTQESIAECVQCLIHTGEPDVVFIGCSAFRACSPNFISDLEASTGVTIVTSTQAYLWHMLRTAQVEDRLDGYGRLFKQF